MTDQKEPPKNPTMSHTKKEILESYRALEKQLLEQRQAELEPEKRIEEKAKQEALKVADSLSIEGIVKGIGSLKAEIGKTLTQISDRMEEELGKYRSVQKAIAAKEDDLQEVYEIDRSAASLAALIEAQRRKKQEFEDEMAARKSELDEQINNLRFDFEQEKQVLKAATDEAKQEEAKRRKREREEYEYSFKREQQLARDSFEDEKGQAEKEMRQKREEAERDLAEREKSVSQAEQQLEELRAKAEAFPQEKESAVSQAVQQAVERVQAEAKNREELLKKEFDGERKVLTTKIESLEQVIKEQSERVARFSQQLEKSYLQVEGIALKAVESSSEARSVASLRQLVSEQAKKQSQEN